MNIIKADSGKVFRRIADGQIYGNEIALGLSYYINGVKLDKPHVDTVEDFEQIEEPLKEAPEERVLKRRSPLGGAE